MYYNNQISRMEGNKAIIKVARKLLNRIKLVFTQEINIKLDKQRLIKIILQGKRWRLSAAMKIVN